MVKNLKLDFELVFESYLWYLAYVSKSLFSPLPATTGLVDDHILKLLSTLELQQKIIDVVDIPNMTETCSNT